MLSEINCVLLYIKIAPEKYYRKHPTLTISDCQVFFSNFSKELVEDNRSKDGRTVTIYIASLVLICNFLYATTS